MNRLRKVLKMPEANKSAIDKKLLLMKKANRRLEIIGHVFILAVSIVHFITLYFNYYQRLRFWWGMIIIWLVSSLFLRIAFWIKGAPIISHIKVEDDGDGGDFWD